jgi:hypothetical protein
MLRYIEGLWLASFSSPMPSAVLWHNCLLADRFAVTLTKV